jgi:signal transduction histidine kinase
MKKIINFITGNSLGFETEELLVISLTFVAMLMAIFATVFNFILKLGSFLTIATLIGSVWFGILYYAARFKKWYLITKLITVLSIFIFLDFIWFNNAGSLGPMPLVLVMVFSVFMFLWDGWRRVIFIFAYILNLALQMFIELYHPELFSSYASRSDRIFDFYSGFVINICFSAVLIIYIKKLYIREKHKAIESEQLKTAFLANLSHEIRTPMNGIIGFAEMLNKPTLTEEKRQMYTRVIVDNSKRLLTMVSDTLEMSKIELGQIDIIKAPVNIDIFINKLFQFCELKTQQKGLALKLNNNILEKDFTLFTDEQKLWQILNNILNNAIKFTQSGSIELSCVKSNIDIIFSVKDSGIGIENKYHNLIFERFRQVDLTSSRQFGGSGLGLAISKNLVILLNGNIWLESEIGAGSTFFVSIPVMS